MYHKNNKSKEALPFFYFSFTSDIKCTWHCSKTAMMDQVARTDFSRSDIPGSVKWHLILRLFPYTQVDYNEIPASSYPQVIPITNNNDIPRINLPQGTKIIYTDKLLQHYIKQTEQT